MADVAFPEDTYSLVDCFTTSSDDRKQVAWSDPWTVAADPDDPACVLYVASAKDTISGIADHFQVDILAFIQANVGRGVIPTKLIGDPPRPEPQLQPDTSWAGQSFQVCHIPKQLFSKVVAGMHLLLMLPAAAVVSCRLKIMDISPIVATLMAMVNAHQCAAADVHAGRLLPVSTYRSSTSMSHCCCSSLLF